MNVLMLWRAWEFPNPLYERIYDSHGPMPRTFCCERHWAVFFVGSHSKGTPACLTRLAQGICSHHTSALV